MVLGIHLTREGKTFEDPEKYRRIVVKLNYLIVTRHDIVYSVNVVSQYEPNASTCLPFLFPGTGTERGFRF